MIDFLLHPAIVWPLLTDLVLGFVAGCWSKRVLWRVLALPAIVFSVAIGCSLQIGNMFTGTGESGGWARILFIQLTASGLIACGVGILLGYLLRRAVRPA
jgi:hypothetical protein